MKYDYKSIKILFLFIALIHAKGWLLEADAQTLVNFPDANLAAAVRFHLGLGSTDPITQTELTRLTGLFAKDAGIRDLTGLQAAINLQALDLGVNQISDIRPLSGLTNLRQISLSGNQISDIRALSELTKLTTLGIGVNQISDIRPLSRLTNLQWLDISSNPITDISLLGRLSNLEHFYIDAAFDEKNPGVLRRIIPANTQIYFVYPTNASVGVPVPREDLSREEPQQKTVFHRCGVGWSPYGHRQQHPKVMIYALEFEYIQDPRSRYICSTIEIRTGDPTLTHLDGWKLYFGTLYNQSRTPIKLTQTNSQITDGVLRLTPEMLGLESLACRNAYASGQTLPSVHYVLKNKKNTTIDTAYSCFQWGQRAVPQGSPRRLSSQGLQAMKTPRIERYIIDPNSVAITYMDIDDFQWDRPVLSDWLLASRDTSEIDGGNAPANPYKKLTTYWGTLKQHKD